MGRPLLFIDFDGVINQFPDPKVMRRQGTTDWMRPDDPRRAAYAPDNWFRPDRRERLLVHDLGRRFTIRWNAELVARLDALDADKWWLSTWQPETAQLNRALGVDWPTVQWYDPTTREGIWTGKRRTILDALAQNRPIVWLDDEETTYNAGLAIQATPHEAPVLGVGPDSAIGVGRPPDGPRRGFHPQPARRIRRAVRDGRRRARGPLGILIPLRGRKVHIPSGRHWHSRHDCEDDRHPDYVGRHTVRDRCHIAVCEVNTGMMDDGWDDPRLYRRRVKWEC